MKRQKRRGIIVMLFLGIALILTGCGSGGDTGAGAGGITPTTYTALKSCGNGRGRGKCTPTYTVGGTVTGLSGIVVLQNNGEDDLQITSDGTFTFSTALADGSGYNVTVKTQPQGQSCFIANGTGTISGGDVPNVLADCSNNSGTPDITFGTDGIVTYNGGNSYSITTDADGKILITGSHYNGTDHDMVIWRYNSDGSPDTAFSTDGIVTYDGGNDDHGSSIITDTNGNILVTGTSWNGAGYDMDIWRYNSDGTPDTAFGTDGIVTYNRSEERRVGTECRARWSPYHYR